MIAPQGAPPDPGSKGAERLEIAQLGGLRDLDNAESFAQQRTTQKNEQDPLWPCPPEIEAELLECIPAVLHDETFERLRAIGAVCGDADDADPLYFDQVCKTAPGCFEFVRNLREPGPAFRSIIIPARDEAGDLADLVAWRVETDEVLTWSGRVCALGQDRILAPRLAEHLTVHETVLAWLRAAQQGVYVLDYQRAAPLLSLGGPLFVDRAEFGRTLDKKLTLRAPLIFAKASEARAAA